MLFVVRTTPEVDEVLSQFAGEERMRVGLH